MPPLKPGREVPIKRFHPFSPVRLRLRPVFYRNARGSLKEITNKYRFDTGIFLQDLEQKNIWYTEGYGYIRVIHPCQVEEAWFALGKKTWEEGCSAYDKHSFMAVLYLLRMWNQISNKKARENWAAKKRVQPEMDDYIHLPDAPQETFQHGNYLFEWALFISGVIRGCTREVQIQINEKLGLLIDEERDSTNVEAMDVEAPNAEAPNAEAPNNHAESVMDMIAAMEKVDLDAVEREAGGGGGGVGVGPIRNGGESTPTRRDQDLMIDRLDEEVQLEEENSMVRVM